MNKRLLIFLTAAMMYPVYGTEHISWAPLQIMSLRGELTDTAASVRGLAVALFYGRTDEVRGLTLGIGASTVSRQYGMQFGIVSESGANCGLQSGIINRTGKNSGVQFGIVNQAADGVQIGLLNRNDNAPLRYFPLLNCGFATDKGETDSKPADQSAGKPVPARTRITVE